MILNSQFFKDFLSHPPSSTAKQEFLLHYHFLTMSYKRRCRTLNTVSSLYKLSSCHEPISANSVVLASKKKCAHKYFLSNCHDVITLSLFLCFKVRHNLLWAEVVVTCTAYIRLSNAPCTCLLLSSADTAFSHQVWVMCHQRIVRLPSPLHIRKFTVVVLLSSFILGHIHWVVHGTMAQQQH